MFEEEKRYRFRFMFRFQFQNVDSFRRSNVTDELFGATKGFFHTYIIIIVQSGTIAEQRRTLFYFVQQRSLAGRRSGERSSNPSPLLLPPQFSIIAVVTDVFAEISCRIKPFSLYRVASLCRTSSPQRCSAVSYCLASADCSLCQLHLLLLIDDTSLLVRSLRSACFELRSRCKIKRNGVHNKWKDGAVKRG